MPSNPEIQSTLVENGVGLLLTPFSQRNASDRNWIWAADNGCFSSRWDYKTWITWLRGKQNPEEALFAVVPDSICNAVETREKWDNYFTSVSELGFKPGFVLQDNATDNQIPWDQLECLFIGGSTEYKLSEDARLHVAKAKSMGKWVHMGRVNSKKRIEIAVQWGCDSVDGTFLAFGPDKNTPKLIKMVEHGNRLRLEI
jgi:hypothetical protein